jgi:hypothetical protein
MDYSEQLNTALAEMVAPIQAHLDQIEREIEDAETKLAALKEARKRATTVLYDADPSLKPSKTKSKSNGGTTSRISPARMELFREWVEANRDDINEGVGISGTDLSFKHPELFGNQSTANKALKELHEEGVLRLDSMGRGGRKNYKVV